MNDSKKRSVVRYRKHLFYLALALIALLEIFIPRDPHFWFDGLPGFYAVFGLTACLFSIIVYKAVGKYWLSVREDYYENVKCQSSNAKGNDREGEKAS